MRKKVIVLGSTGLIGHTIYKLLDKTRKFELFNISRTKLNNETKLVDITSPLDLDSLIQGIRPNVVINCIGILNKEIDVKTEDEFLIINGLLPKHLSDLSESIGFKLIQISTDCVFSGEGGPYSEESKPDATDIYGRSKSIGEEIALKNLIIRTSVIGPDLFGKNGELFDWFMLQKGNVMGYQNVFWSGVTTFELARCVFYCINNDITGLKNLSMRDFISKYELLKKLNFYTKRNLKLVKIKEPISNKVLVSKSNWYKKKYLDYDSMLDEMINEIRKDSNYLHYQL